MATIIATHIAANIAPALSQPWPGILIHAIPMVQPPGIGITPLIMRDDDSVSAAAPRKTTSALMWIDRRLFDVVAERSSPITPIPTGLQGDVRFNEARVPMFDDGERAMGAWAIELDRAGAFQHLGGRDLRTEVLHPLGHLDEDAVRIAGGDVQDRLADGFELARDADTRMALREIEFEFDRHELGFEDRRDDAGDDFEPGVAGLTAHDSQERVPLLGSGFVADVGLQRAVAFVKRSRPIVGARTDDVVEARFVEMPLANPHREHAGAFVMGRRRPEIARTAGRAVTVFEVLAAHHPISRHVPSLPRRGL